MIYYLTEQIIPFIKRMWNKLIGVIHAIAIIISCLIVYVAIVYVGYYLFKDFNAMKVVIGCVVTCVMIHVNKSLQTGV